jgi:AraC-like DNA-binding protein
MDQAPFHQKERFNTSFPFLLRDSDMPDFNFPLHWHERLELIYVLKGNLHVVLDGKHWEAHERDLVIVEKSVVHGFFDPSPGTSVRMYQFDHEIFGEDPIRTLEMPNWNPYYASRPVITRGEDGKLHRQLENCLMEMHREYEDQDIGFQLAVKSKLFEFTTMLLRKMPELPFSPDGKRVFDQRLGRVTAFLRRNYDKDDLTLERAAQEAGMSKFHFSRYFKEQTGENFHPWLARLRVRHAKEFLFQGDKPITDIAFQCGFSSIATFNRVFKAYTGDSPFKYRNGKRQAL